MQVADFRLSARQRRVKDHRSCLTITGSLVDQAARVLIAEVRSIVQELLADKLRVQMEKRGLAVGVHAMAVVESLTKRLGPLVVAHDKAGTALKLALPDAPTILSLITEEPA